MDDIEFDGKKYRIEQWSSYKRNPQLDDAIAFRIEEEDGEQRASIWNMEYTDGKHLLSLERDEEIPDLNDPDHQFTVAGSDFIALQNFFRKFDEYRDLDNSSNIITVSDADLADSIDELLDGRNSIGSDELRDVIGKMVQSLSELSQELDDTDLSPVLAEEDTIQAQSMLKHASATHAIRRLEDIIRYDQSEKKCQDLLEDHPWMLGSRYVGQHGRTLPSGKEVDFALETVDGYLDIIEIKTPGANVVNKDTDHETYYPYSDLNKTISQLSTYIHSSQRHQDFIENDKGSKPLKPRGIIIIGSDLDEEEKDGLRIVESHLNRIEIITYSDLLQRAKQYQNMYEDDGSLELGLPSNTGSDK